MASALSSGTRKYLHLRGTDPNLETSPVRQENASKTLEDTGVTVPDDEHYDIDGTSYHTDPSDLHTKPQLYILQCSQRSLSTQALASCQ
jgi:hypothetical protein